MTDPKCPEVTFKYYLPENQDDLYLHIHAPSMYSLLYDLDQMCREVLKYEGNAGEGRAALAESIRCMISEGIDFSMVR